MMLNSAETALARHHTYTVLSRVLLEGVSAELRPYIEAIPDLAATVDTVDAGTHQHLFRFNLFPYESVFRGTSGLVGGPVTDAVAEAWVAAGLAPPSDPDLIGNELALLASLCRAEATGHNEDAAREQQRRFLSGHLLVWLPALTVAMQRQNQPFYGAIASLLWQLVTEHAAALGVSEATSPNLLPVQPDLLADERTGVKTIVRFLATPAYSGVWFGRNTVAALGRRHNVPRGFGGRIDMGMTLFRSAVAYDGARGLLADLQSLAQAWRVAYDQLRDTAPHLASYVALWGGRAAQTATLFGRMDAILAEETAPDSTQL